MESELSKLARLRRAGSRRVDVDKRGSTKTPEDADKASSAATELVFEHKWRRYEVYGLWTAAFVGMLAVVQSCQDSDEQRQELELQRQTTIEQTRGRLEIRDDGLTLTKHAFKDPNSGKPSYEYEIEATYINIGDSPADDVKQTSAVTLLAPKPDEHFTLCNGSLKTAYRFDDGFWWVEENSRGATIDPHQNVRLFIGGADVEAAQLVKTPGRVFAVVQALVTYRDAFPKTAEHHVSWCAQIDFGPDGNARTDVFYYKKAD